VRRPPIRVYVVDDDSLLRTNLVRLLEQAGYVVRTFASGKAFLAAYPKLLPGCIIMDLIMQGMSGLELQRRLISAGCKWPVIVLTGHGDRTSAQRAIESGAVAFLEKPVRRTELLAALLRGESYLIGATDTIPDPELAHRVARLTRREREVLGGILTSMINKEIAAEFGISESSVKGYRRKAMEKLGARTPAELVMLALRAGFVSKPRS
jgi:FixJ family two-component response regulator